MLCDVAVAVNNDQPLVLTEFEKLIGVKSVVRTGDDSMSTRDSEIESKSDGYVCESCHVVARNRQGQQTGGSDTEGQRKRQ